MLNDLLQQIKQEIKFGYLKRKHPFRYPVLASLRSGKPVQRTIVLRDVTNDFELIFFTDSRSHKMQDFTLNPNASVLFYHPKKLLQVQVTGIVEFIKEGSLYTHYWSRVQGNSTKDYTTQQAPGTRIDHPEEVSYLAEGHHFCVLKLIPTEIESLQLNRTAHLRATFTAANDWNGLYLNP